MPLAQPVSLFRTFGVPRLRELFRRIIRSVHTGGCAVKTIAVAVERKRNNCCGGSLRYDSDIGIYGVSGKWSLRLDVGRADHLAPSLGFLGNERTELDRREGHRRSCRIGKSRPNRRVRQPRSDHLTELLYNFRRCSFRYAHPVPRVCRISWNGIADSRNVWQQSGSSGRCHRQSTQQT